MRVAATRLNTGFQETPVLSIATRVTPSAVLLQARNLSHHRRDQCGSRPRSLAGMSSRA